jgi:hypothetical protein
MLQQQGANGFWQKNKSGTHIISGAVVLYLFLPSADHA